MWIVGFKLIFQKQLIIFESDKVWIYQEIQVTIDPIVWTVNDAGTPNW